MIRLLLLACLLPRAFAEVGVDLDQVECGPAIDLAPGQHPEWYRALYQDRGSNPDFLVRRCRQGAGDRALTLLAARLLHRAAERDDDAALRRQRSLHAAVLRCLRGADAPGLLEVYRRYLAVEIRVELLRSLLVNVERLDPQRACVMAARLAIAGENAPPAARDKEVRRMALHFAAGLAESDPASYRQALDHAVVHGTPDEATDALDLVPTAERGDLATRALARFLPPYDENVNDARAVIRRTLPSYRSEADQELTARILTLLPLAPRSFICQLANGVAAGNFTVVPREGIIDRLVDRARRTPDVPLRNAICQLLLHWAPARLAELPGAGEVLGRIAADREKRGADR